MREGMGNVVLTMRCQGGILYGTVTDEGMAG